MNEPEKECPICRLKEEGKPICAIAYADKDWNEYKGRYPYICDVGELEKAREKAVGMERKCIGCIDWSFVEGIRITEKPGCGFPAFLLPSI